jgi:hypothetical protein
LGAGSFSIGTKGEAPRISLALWANAIAPTRVPAAAKTTSNETAVRAVGCRRAATPGMIPIWFVGFIFLFGLFDVFVYAEFVSRIFLLRSLPAHFCAAGRMGGYSFSAAALVLRSGLKPDHTSSENSCGCSQAAKWPPLSSLL